MAPVRMLKGYMAACIVASGSMVLILALSHSSSFPALILIWPIALIFTVITAFVPALITIAISEWFKIRRIWFFALSGTAIGVALAHNFVDGQSAIPATEMVLFTGPSLLGSLVYWRLAGRFSGSGALIFIPPLDQGVLETRREPNGLDENLAPRKPPDE